MDISLLQLTHQNPSVIKCHQAKNVVRVGELIIHTYFLARLHIKIVIYPLTHPLGFFIHSLALFPNNYIY